MRLPRLNVRVELESLANRLTVLDLAVEKNHTAEAFLRVCAPKVRAVTNRGRGLEPDSFGVSAPLGSPLALRGSSHLLRTFIPCGGVVGVVGLVLSVHVHRLLLVENLAEIAG